MQKSEKLKKHRNFIPPAHIEGVVQNFFFLESWFFVLSPILSNIDFEYKFFSQMWSPLLSSDKGSTYKKNVIQHNCDACIFSSVKIAKFFRETEEWFKTAYIVLSLTFPGWF